MDAAGRAFQKTSILPRTQMVRRWILTGAADRCLQELERNDPDALAQGMRSAPVIANVAVYTDGVIEQFFNDPRSQGRATTVFNVLVYRTLGPEAAGEGKGRAGA
jgi:hypothetical protein